MSIIQQLTENGYLIGAALTGAQLRILVTGLYFSSCFQSANNNGCVNLLTQPELSYGCHRRFADLSWRLGLWLVPSNPEALLPHPILWRTYALVLSLYRIPCLWVKLSEPGSCDTWTIKVWLEFKNTDRWTSSSSGVGAGAVKLTIEMFSPFF